MTPIETSIVRQCVTDLIAAGYPLSVLVGVDVPLGCSRDPDAILEVLNTTNEATLLVHPAGDPRDFPWVRFTFGGEAEWNVILDYTMDLYPYLEGAKALADQFEEAANQ